MQLTIAMSGLVSEKSAAEGTLESLVSQLDDIKELTAQVEEDCRLLGDQKMADLKDQQRIQTLLCDLSADLQVLHSLIADGMVSANDADMQWLAYDIVRQRMKEELEQADAALISLRELVEVQKSKLQVLRQEVEGAEMFKVEAEAAKHVICKLQQELQKMQREHDTLAHGIQALDGAKSKQMQRMMELQGTISTLKYEIEAEKKRAVSLEQERADERQLHDQQLQASACRENEACERAATLQMERDILNYELSQVKEAHRALEVDVDKLRLEGNQSTRHAAGLEAQLVELSQALASTIHDVEHDVDQKVQRIKQVLWQAESRCLELVVSRQADVGEFLRLTESTHVLENTMIQAQAALKTSQVRSKKVIFRIVCLWIACNLALIDDAVTTQEREAQLLGKMQAAQNYAQELSQVSGS